MDTLTVTTARVRVRIDEPTARFWQDSDITQWINEATRDVARRTESLQAITTINAVAGTQQYALPSDTLRVYRVEWSRDGATGTAVIPLEYRDFASMDSVWWTSQKTSQGDPYWFTMWGFPPNLNVVLYPIPSVTITAGVKVYYYRLPIQVVSGADIVEVPDGYKDLIDDYCEFSALRKDSDPRWQEAKSLYEQKLEGMLENTRRWTDQSDSIQGGTGGPIPRWIWGGEY